MSETDPRDRLPQERANLERELASAELGQFEEWIVRLTRQRDELAKRCAAHADECERWRRETSVADQLVDHCYQLLTERFRRIAGQ